MKLSLGEAREPERLEQHALLADKFLRHELADADHLVAVIGVGDDMAVLPECIDYRETVRREAANPARGLVTMLGRSRPILWTLGKSSGKRGGQRCEESSPS